MSTVHITPQIKELVLNQKVKCPEQNCAREFINIGNLKMHLTRHHKRENLKSQENDERKVNKLYFCPIENCTYNERSMTKKHFSTLKYLRQHYKKVHAEKSFKCDKCEKMFCTEKLKNSHEINCGNRKFVCDECGWMYTSREALLTHAKRKNHKIKQAQSEQKIKLVNDRKITSIMPIVIIVKPSMADKIIQTDNTMKSTTFLHPQANNKKTRATKRDHQNSSTSKVVPDLKKGKHVEIQKNKTEPTPTTDQCVATIFSPTKVTIKAEKKEEFFNLNLYEAATESQCTENNHENFNRLNYVDDNDTIVSNCFDQFVNSGFCNIETQTEFSDAFLDQMLYSNMHTQTCDEFLSELGLSDIQTQTNWSGVTEDDFNHHGKHDAATSGAYDELLVSTETQTSFTQCLLECKENNSNSNCGNNSVGLVNAITQHTQTCDTLLEGLFGGQENDFIGNFQSTHTQT